MNLPELVKEWVPREPDVTALHREIRKLWGHACMQKGGGTSQRPAERAFPAGSGKRRADVDTGDDRAALA